VRDAFIAFVTHLEHRLGPNRAAVRLCHDHSFFAALDVDFPRSSDVDPDGLLRVAQKAGLRRNLLARRFLMESGIIPSFDVEGWESAIEWQKQERLLLKVSLDESMKAVLSRYRDHIAHVDRKKGSRWVDAASLRPRSVTANLKAAVCFLEFVAEKNSRLAHHEALFLNRHRGYATAVRAFIRFLGYG